MGRTATVARETTETKIALAVDIDGTGQATIHTGIGFFDHMLTLLAGHSLFDLSIQCEGDVHVDGHHTVEDVGRALGVAVKDCLGDRRGIRRYGHSVLPMDESLVNKTRILVRCRWIFLIGSVKGNVEPLACHIEIVWWSCWRSCNKSCCFV